MKANPLLSLLTCIALLATPCFRLRADNEIGFIEKFALAADREKALAELAPGTEKFYFYHALHYQNTKDAAKLADTLKAWRKQFRTSPLRESVENREALLAYDTDPKRTLDYLKDKLRLHFDHQQEVRDKKPDLPTALDPGKISRDVFQDMALKHDDLAGVSEWELEHLVQDKTPLSVPQVRALLQRLSQPEVPGLVELIAQDLKRDDSPAFGAFPIHAKLLPDQLEHLAKLVPQLVSEPAYVRARLRKIQPGADEDAEFNPAVRETWLARLWAYAKNLPAAFNSIKSSILYQRLDHDRHQGVYDRERFLDYLRLPRQVSYLAPKWEDRLKKTEAPWSDLNASSDETGLPFAPIGNDEALVREYFLNLFATSAPARNSPAALDPYTDYVDAKWLKPVFAEAMIVSGKDKPERWSSLLSPAAFQALKDRVDIEFAPQNAPFITPGTDVAVDLYLKNVPKLIVCIYEINTLGFFLQQHRQINTDLNLDGLVANSEATHAYTEIPFQRVRRSFQFPELKGKRGAWIIEFIGGGRSSRALIRSGQYHLLQRCSSAGDLITVLDERHEPVKDAAVWLDGRQIKPDAKTGFIVAPFTAAPGRKPIILANAEGSFATLAEFEHHGEDYQLKAQFYLNREQLLAGREATLAINAELLAGDALQPLSLLKDAKLSITTTTLDGVNTTHEVKDLAMEPGKLFTHPFTVPDRLTNVTATLTAAVEQISKGGDKSYLTATQNWAVNTLDASDATHAGHISKFGGSYVYELLGRDAEPVADAQVLFDFKRQGFGSQVRVALRTDEAGRIELGDLAGVQSFQASATGSSAVTSWSGSQSARTLDDPIHATPEDVIEVPLLESFTPGSYTLLEVREGEWVADRTDRIQVPADPKASLQLTISALPPGDYLLFLRDEDRSIKIAVAQGTHAFGWVFGGRRHLEMGGLHPLNIMGAGIVGEDLVIQLRNTNRFTRVHVAAERFLPAFPFFGTLSGFPRFGPAGEIPAQAPNLYSTGREIGDEYRYILDRRFAKVFPGNMLTRPGLLLNPWELRTTGQTDTLQRGGQAAGATPGGRANAPMTPNPNVSSYGFLGDHYTGTPAPNLDFLATAAPLLLNLVPDKDGVVRVPKKQLGDRQFIEIYVEDLTHAVERVVSLPESDTKLQDLRLARVLDPAKPFAEKKQATVLQSSGSLTLADIRTSELENYDTLGGVFSLYTTLSANPELAKFAWILGWPKLKDDEKRAKYSEFACHELSFFLSRKDSAFFDKVIKPYLANKKEKTFLDDYLLGSDLHRYLEPWRYGRLNAAEQALLGRRLPEETAAAARHLRELWELLPPDEAEQERLFETALRGRALEAIPSSVTLSSSSGSTITISGTISGDGNLSLREAMKAQTSKLEREATTPAPMAQFAGKAKGARAHSAQKGTVFSFETDEGVLNHVAGGLVAPTQGVIGGFADLSEPQLQERLGELRENARAYYRALGPVKEWAENNYWHLPLSQQGPELITVNAFWRDLAAWDGKGAFVSSHFAEVHRSFAEIMLALGVLDLPFAAPKNVSNITDARMTVTAGGSMVVYHKEILPATPAPAGEARQLLVSQAFFRKDDRYRMEGNLRFDKYVAKEFLTGVVYGANVVVTNPSSAPADIDLLLQIPQGALPVLKSRATESRHLMLDPYTTKTFEYYFYFPKVPAEGTQFAHYPVNASIHGAAAAAAPAFTFNVVSKLTEVDKASWDYVSQYGSDAEVLAFLDQNNIERLNLERAAWRCRKDASFFRQMVAVLERRHHYDSTIYSYGVLHNDTATLGQFLQHQDAFLARCGDWLDSGLLRIDPIERRTYEHLEYAPLVNQRVHRLGGERHITTPEQRTQYMKLMAILADKPALDAMDQMSVVYHLFLQDRVEEALERFHAIAAETVLTRIQYDYLKCYADFYEGNLADARGIASQHANEPVNRWRALFAEVSSQLDEIEGKGAKDAAKPDREKAQAALASTEPSFEFKVEKQMLALSWKNLKELTVNYYLLDPEFAFSSSPFASQGAERSSMIKPNRSAKLQLPADRAAWETPLPGEYAKANVLIEVLGAGQRKASTHHANTLKLDLTENYGRLEVRDQTTDKPLPRTYVKVYARLHNGTVRFFKDGYTDLRGRYDYASLNSPANPIAPQSSPGAMPANGLDYQMLKPGELDAVDKLAILILSDTNGAEVREVAPPSQ